MDSILGSGRFPGGGYGKPLQYFCLENPMDRGAWRGVVHSITKNQTRLKPLTVQTPALIYSTCLVPVGRFAANRLPRAESATGPGFCSKMAPPSAAPAVCVQGNFIENALVICGLEGSQFPVMPTFVCQHRPDGPGLKHGGAVLHFSVRGLRWVLCKWLWKTGAHQYPLSLS